MKPILDPLEEIIEDVSSDEKPEKVKAAPKKKANSKRGKKKTFVVIRKPNFNVAVVIKAKNKVIAGDFTRRSKIVQENIRKTELKRDLKQCVLAVGTKDGKSLVVKHEP